MIKNWPSLKNVSPLQFTATTQTVDLHPEGKSGKEGGGTHES